MDLFWRGITRYHDWYDKRRTIPRNMLDQAQQAGLIGSVDWISVGPDDKEINVEHKPDSLHRLLDHRPKRGESYRIAAGGSMPSVWKMTLGLFPFNKSTGQVRGYNILNLWFPAEDWIGKNRSDALARHLRTIHTPDNTEVAFIHPYKRWSELSDNLKGLYGSPVTATPFFSGVYWTNFLGRGHLELFDVSKLRDLRTYEVDWIDQVGLFLRACSDVSEATSQDVEQEMLRLTEIFRAARR